MSKLTLKSTAAAIEESKCAANKVLSYMKILEHYVINVCKCVCNGNCDWRLARVVKN